MLDVRFISFRASTEDNSNHDKKTYKTNPSPLFDVTGSRRDLTSSKRAKKPIKYPIKDLAPSDDEEDASGSGSKGRH